MLEDIGSIITKQALRVKMELVDVIIEVVISSRRMGVPKPPRLAIEAVKVEL